MVTIADLQAHNKAHDIEKSLRSHISQPYYQVVVSFGGNLIRAKLLLFRIK